MSKIFSFFACLLILSDLLHSAEKPREELIVVQTVSRERKSFVVSKGIKEGVLKNQEILFSNDRVSILCKAIEVSRNFSLWVPVDPYVNIPFNKEEIISFNSYTYGNVSLDVVGDVNNITPDVNYNLVYKKFRTSNNFSAKVSLNRGLSQSSSDVSADNNSSRSGYSFTGEYNYRLIPEFEMSAGLRLDNEVYRIKSAELDVPTSRVLGTLAATYHFIPFSSNKNNLYLSVAAGIGTSTTTINAVKSSGTVTLLPEARLGYIMPFSPTLAMLFEGAIESLSAKEKINGETEQTTNILNAKLTIGLRF